MLAMSLTHSSKHFPHMSHLKVTLGPGNIIAPPTYVVKLFIVALITLKLFQISGIFGRYDSLVTSSASSDEVEIKISAALIAFTDFPVF